MLFTILYLFLAPQVNGLAISYCSPENNAGSFPVCKFDLSHFSKSETDIVCWQTRTSTNPMENVKGIAKDHMHLLFSKVKIAGAPTIFPWNRLALMIATNPVQAFQTIGAVPLMPAYMAITS